MTVAVKVLELPVPAKLKFATSGCGPTTTVVEAVAEAPLASLTVNDSGNVPLVGCVTVNVPVPVYGLVPPLAETVQVNALPAVMGDEHVTVAVRGWPATVTDADPEALTPFPSVTLNVSVFVPLVDSVLVKVPTPV